VRVRSRAVLRQCRVEVGFEPPVDVDVGLQRLQVEVNPDLSELRLQVLADVDPGIVLAKLGLPERAKVVRLERVRYADGEPMAVETVYLDHERFAEIGDLLTTDGSLYKLLDDRYGVVPVAADETIETVLATPAASRLLGTDSTTPMLLLTRCSSDAAGQPVEYVRSLYRGDRYRFIARIRRPEV
jgi:DNA-binding GntR family transcriptional regulator